MIEVRQYSSNDAELWNNFVSVSKNGTFLFRRSYMDYHSDRFVDNSLMVFEDSQLVAILPANITKDSQIISHGGLSYGGMLVKFNEYTNTTINYFAAILEFLYKSNFDSLIIKQIPDIFVKQSHQEFEYIFSVLGAQLIRTDLSTYLDLRLQDSQYQERKKRNIKKANKHSLEIKSGEFIDVFWSSLLIPNLMERYGLRPVHSAEEMKLLADLHPGNIKIFGAFKGDEMIAGTTIFETENVAHAQYIAANNLGKDLGANDFLFDFLITKVFTNKMYFSFGVSNERGRAYLNTGLLQWKEGFGGRSIVYRVYEIETKRFETLLNLIK